MKISNLFESEKNFTINYYDKNGEWHREDGPAVIYANGHKEWYKNGEWHREDGPAVIWANGHKEWYQYGELHCDDGPAVILDDGRKEWYQNGKYYGEGDTPPQEWIDAGGHYENK